MKKLTLLPFKAMAILALPFAVNAQKPAFTANNKVEPYNAVFAYGTNPGYYGGFNNNNPNDILVADLITKAGLHTTRPALYDNFLEQWGLNIRLDAFKHYEEIGMKELTLFLNQPSDAHRSTATITCDGASTRSDMFKNLYEPIWDDSANGRTPINDQNYYAAYVYKVVKTYGKNVRFYEVWNEPDFTYGGSQFLKPGQAGNWWENNPKPCELTNMHAPIQEYIRTLRITYEVVKSINPAAYVTTGGLGYESFLDAILRNTDNPDNGKVTPAYPLKGGAYFDVLSYHSYPQYSLNKWDNAISGFRYFRHSDAAKDKIFELRDVFKSRLVKYGYDGATYPEKLFIITETNIPRKEFTGKDWIGSPEAQRNFVMKAFVSAQKQNIKQLYTFTCGDTKDETASVGSGDGMDIMGMYYNLNKATPSTAKLTPAGIGSKSLSDFLYGYRYDATKTSALKLPITVDGGAFTKDGETRYVLWAKTTSDRSEVVSATYNFPTEMKVLSATVRQWNNSQTPGSTTVDGNSLSLTGAPVLVTIKTANDGPTGLFDEVEEIASFKVFPNPVKDNFEVDFLNKDAQVSLQLFDLQGNEVKTFLNKASIGIGQQNLSFSLAGLKPGLYHLRLASGAQASVAKIVVEQ